MKKRQAIHTYRFIAFLLFVKDGDSDRDVSLSFGFQG
jgi:hypothetical protein